MHEFLFPCRSRICCKCSNCVAFGICGFGDVGAVVDEGVPGGAPPAATGNDCLLLRRNAGLKLYFILACNNNSLNTLDTFILSFADVSTNPFSQSTVTTDSVVSLST